MWNCLWSSWWIPWDLEITHQETAKISSLPYQAKTDEIRQAIRIKFWCSAKLCLVINIFNSWLVVQNNPIGFFCRFAPREQVFIIGKDYHTPYKGRKGLLNTIQVQICSCRTIRFWKLDCSCHPLFSGFFSTLFHVNSWQLHPHSFLGRNLVVQCKPCFRLLQQFVVN